MYIAGKYNYDLSPNQFIECDHKNYVWEWE